ncbi:uncharacterized protein [Aristolochia californica]|uniref:uncharacterized protein n=1 Tax=Aristolochia californica TaxID=171875 RepID=UPI0035D5E78E
MPLTRLAADAFGVVTVILVCLLTLLGLLCICYSIYFRSRVRQHDFHQLGYFNGPWVIRIALILITIWWGLGEIIRLTVLKVSGRALHSLSLKWQENICKFYILSNLGFAEPCLFLILGLLLHASLQRRDVGTLSPRWNRKTFTYVLLFCFPVFVAQLVLILIGSKLNNEKRYIRMLPKYFTSTSASSRIEGYIDTAVCTYPLLNTILHGFFAIVVVFYFGYLGVRMVSLVINKGLRRRVYLLIASIVGFLPFRVLFLGFSVLSNPGKFAFEVLVFSAFFMLISCSAVGICLLVYCPVADSLALRTFQRLETGDWPGPVLLDDTDGSNVATQSLLEVASTSAGRNSDASMKGGSISFRTMIKDEGTQGGLEELGLFSSNTLSFFSPPGSPPLPGRPMIPLRQFSDY